MGEKTLQGRRSLEDETNRYFGRRSRTVVVFTEPMDGRESFREELDRFVTARLDPGEPGTVREAAVAGYHPVVLRISRQVIVDRDRDCEEAGEMIVLPRRIVEQHAYATTEAEAEALYDILARRLTARWGDNAVGRIEDCCAFVAPLKRGERVVEVWFGNKPMPGARFAA